MTFQTQIESLIGFRLNNTSASTSECTQFLQDGVREVINRVTTLTPQDTIKFCKQTSDDSNAGIIYTGKIYSIVRQHDDASLLRKCTPIPADLKTSALDIDSIYYRSKYNPAYYIEGSTNAHGSKIYSAPASAGSNNAILVTQVYYDTGLAFGDDDIDNFPSEYQYLVPLYAAIKVIEQKISRLTTLEEDIELSNTLNSTLASLKQNYERAFVMASPQRQEKEEE